MNVRPETLARLHAAGWKQSRRVDTTVAAAALTGAGYPVWPDLLSFLEEFDDLSVSFDRGHGPDRLWFNARRASAMADPEWLRFYGEREHTAFVPVGYAHTDHLLLMAGRNGRYLGGFDDFVMDLGNGPLVMIERLMSSDEAPE